MPDPKTVACPLCNAISDSIFHASDRGTFYRCDRCALVFLDPAQWPSLDSEIARYELHENDPADPAHQEFLSRLAAPVIARVPAGARGLDYGSGESDALAGILTRSGRPTATYDPAFRPGAAALRERYDFIVCSEVLEHVHEPWALFQRFQHLLRPGGIIGVMTGMYDAVPSFADWWYIRDITHVCFYSKETMEWVALRMGWTVHFPSGGVSIFLTLAVP